MNLLVFLTLFFFGLAIEAQTSPAPTVAEAEEFMNKAEARLSDLNVKVNQATWVHDNFITEDTEALAADANDENTAATTELVEGAKRFESLQMPPELARKFKLLKLSLTAPAPKDPKLRRELTQIAASLESDYGKGKYCRKPDECLDITTIERMMGTSRDPNELRDLWIGWHKVGAPMRQRYVRFVELSNQGAREIGFKDTGAMWRSNYDMAPQAFSADLERLWQQVRPLYLSLHAYVRSKLVQKYGPQTVPPDGPIPAHLLGNPWAQEWGNTYSLLGLPEKSGVDLTALLKAKNLDPKGMVKYGENFFISMGFAPLPQTFWERSLFV
ncbi:MAG TPA: M2 family metallopeptidase, partial [Terriglobales bacterium]|nr:M2 family metallopeptidase [Terriglobales bacterium]